MQRKTFDIPEALAKAFDALAERQQFLRVEAAPARERRVHGVINSEKPPIARTTRSECLPKTVSIRFFGDRQIALQCRQPTLFYNPSGETATPSIDVAPLFNVVTYLPDG